MPRLLEICRAAIDRGPLWGEVVLPESLKVRLQADDNAGLKIAVLAPGRMGFLDR